MADEERTFAYRVAYDGSRFHGMQVQPKLATVQGAIEAGLARFLKRPTRIRFAGRTDTGVHATAQMVAFDVPTKIPVASLRKLMNRRLGGAARFGTGWEADPGFHPRFSAIMREYTYILDDSGAPPDPFRAGQVTFVEAGLDWERALACAQPLLGTHDFRGFCQGPTKEPQPIRHIENLSIEARGRYRFVTVRGRSFLRGMVRHVVGALLHLARGERSEDFVVELLARGARGEKDGALIPATAAGLYLTGVEYPEGFPSRTAILVPGATATEEWPWLG